jgi:sugar transferase (PEP-CTERM/EpsH1 system associated)
MRALFLTHRLPYAPNRGDRIRAYHLLREMARFADVSLVSLVHDDEEQSHAGAVPFATSIVTARSSRTRSIVRGAAGLLTGRPLTHMLLDAPGLSSTLATLVTREPPDVVLAYCSGMARLALEPPLDGLPFVLDMVDVDSAKWAALAGSSRGIRRWVYGREARTLGSFEASAATRARATLAINAREGESLRAVAPDARIHVIGNGIDLEAFRPPDAPVDRLTVIFAGVLDYAPNEAGVRWFATEVWPRVRSAVPAARLALVGSGVTRALRRLAADDSSIDIIGAVQAVQPHLWKAAVSVAPLRVARGLQNKVLEALAAGLPVVVTQQVNDGLPLEARGGCVVADSAEAFASAVTALLRTSAGDRRRRASQAALEHLTWAEQLAPLEQILREAAVRPTQRGARSA